MANLSKCYTFKNQNRRFGTKRIKFRPLNRLCITEQHCTLLFFHTSWSALQILRGNDPCPYVFRSTSLFNVQCALGLYKVGGGWLPDQRSNTWKLVRRSNFFKSSMLSLNDEGNLKYGNGLIPERKMTLKDSQLFAESSRLLEILKASYSIQITT